MHAQVIIVNFDVIARPGKELGARLPDPEGMRLWKMFHDQTMGRIALVIDEEVPKDIFEHWLKVNQVKPAIYEMLDVVHPDLKAEKVHILSMTMGISDWYVDNDPYACAFTLRLGIPTLLVCNPYVVRPEWSGVKAARPWDTIVTEIDNQSLQRAERTWGDA